jgi:hypothetical protein
MSKPKRKPKQPWIQRAAALLGCDKKSESTQQEHERRLRLVAARLPDLGATHKKLLISETSHCLDRLHANEESLESRLTLFLGIAVGGAGGIGGYMYTFLLDHPEKIADSRVVVGMMAMGAFSLAALVLMEGLIARHGYWSKGCSPHHILESDLMEAENYAAFENGIIEGMQERCDKIELRNARLAQALNKGLVIIAVAPIATIIMLVLLILV